MIARPAAKRDIETLEKLQQIRPNFETPAIRRKVDDIAYDYLADIEIGLRDDSRPTRIGSAFVVARGSSASGSAWRPARRLMWT